MQEKKHKPTAKRLREAAQQGKTPKSALVSQICAMFSGALGLGLYLSFPWVSFDLLLKYRLIANVDQLDEIFWQAGFEAFNVGLSFVLPAVVVGVLVEVVQVGLGVNFSLAVPDFMRINPMRGVQNLLDSLRQSLLPCLSLLVLAAIFVWVAASLPLKAASATSIELAGTIWWLKTNLITWFGLASVPLMIGALGDIWHKRRKFYSEVGLSDEELRRELREDEGDPHLRSARRSLHEAILMQELGRRIRRAKVVVVKKRS